MQRCVTTVCGHNYCEYCLDDYLIYKKHCFVCDFKTTKKQIIREKPLMGNFKIDDFIRQMVDNCSVKEVKDDWEKR